MRSWVELIREKVRLPSAVLEKSWLSIKKCLFLSLFPYVVIRIELTIFFNCRLTP